MAVTAQVEAAPPVDRPLAASRSSRWAVDGWETVILVLFAGISIWVLGYDVWLAAVHGRVWTGSVGMYPGDQLQYMAWIRDASHHLLISDLYVVHPTPHDYLEPLVALAGGLTALGLPPWAGLLAFQPLAVVALFLAIRAYVQRSVTGRWDRRAALTLALFAGPLVLFGPFGSVAAEWLPFWTWGYLPSVFAVAAQVGALLAYDHTMKRGRRVWMAPALGLVASWLHPWQGEELLLIVLVYELGSRTRAGRRYLEPPGAVRRAPRVLPWLTAIATLLPLTYYVLLDRLDPIWDMAQDAAALHKSPGVVLLPLVPLLLAAGLGWRGRPRTFLAATSRIWPLAALTVYGLCEAGLGSTPRHAFAGITIPLAVLTIQGARQINLNRGARYRRWAAGLFVAAVTIPTAVVGLSAVPSQVSSAFIAPDAQRALSYLADDPQPGGVLTSRSLGTVTPGVTGRPTYIGNNFWSVPGPRSRQRQVRWLFYHHPNPLAAQRFVLGTGARFVLAPCHVSTDLRRDLAPMLTDVHRFGCASVYTLRVPGRPG